MFNITVVSATGVATMGPRGTMAPSLLSYFFFSIVSMSWFTTSVHAPNVSCTLQLPEVHIIYRNCMVCTVRMGDNDMRIA